ncbi:MAG: T9SS type A sorting domain-containing protein [Paludibacteraceae bacterium]|nr:T9SS type A sorting domain-containing protein [Paludibacteraceae bacterium]
MKHFILNNINSGIGKTLAMLLTVTASFALSTSALAYTVTKGTYYFDNTATQWSDVYLAIGKGNSEWRSSYKMTKVDGTDIYYYVLSSDWTDANGYFFYGGTGWEVNGEAGDYWDWYKNHTASTRTAKQTGESNNNKCYFYQSQGDYDINGAWTPIPTELGRSKVITYVNGNEFVWNCSADGGTKFDGGQIGVITDGKIPLVGEVQSNNNTAKSAIHVYMWYEIDSEGSKTISMPSVNDEDGNWEKHQTAQTDIAVPSQIGNHTIAVSYFSVNNVWDSNDSKNYVANFIVPGFVANDMAMDNTGVGQTSEKEYGFNSYGWINATATIGGTDADAFSFRDGTKERTIEINLDYGSSHIMFSPTESRNYSATLTLKGEANGKKYTETINLTGTADTKSVSVLISKDALVKENYAVDLFGYLQRKGCNGSNLNTIKSYGFYYTKGMESIPTTESTKAEAGTEDKEQGYNFTKGLQLTSGDKGCYSYKAYATTGTNKTTLSAETGHFCIDECPYPLGDTVYVTLDNSIAQSDKCALTFKTFEEAINTVMGFEGYYKSGKLLTNVVFQVVNTGNNYIGTSNASMTGGTATCAKTILLEGFNNVANPDKMLVIRAMNASSKPTVQHLTLRNSKNILLRDLNLEGSSTPCTVSSSSVYDNALDIDNGDGSWGQNDNTANYVDNANISLIHCNITSKGFTCVHISGINGITFEDNNINANLPDEALSDDNTICWGASLKFIHSKNVKLLRNSFRGSHATLAWLQGCQYTLLMNNVFWNENTTHPSGAEYSNVAFVRLVAQRGEVSGKPSEESKNIGIYYNTMYLNEGTQEDRIDFFRLGSKHSTGGTALDVNVGMYDANTIEFKYNNCYSYSMDVPGRTANDDAFLTKGIEVFGSHISTNNFWSKYDAQHTDPTGQSVFAFAASSDESTTFINVEDEVCATESSDPGSLVVKGVNLNKGYKITDDISGQGAEDIYADRLHGSNGDDAIRKSVTDGEWTLGAYQQSFGDRVETIIWNGAIDNDWDNRGNWIKPNGDRVTCVDNLDINLQVIIPAKDSKTYPVPKGGIARYPVIPSNFYDRTIKTESNGTEQVDAGAGYTTSTEKYTSRILLEYGAAIKGVENLVETEKENKVRRYDEVSSSLETGRKEWILVGPMVRPFTNESKNEVRDVVSGDYYIEEHLPHVYINKISADGGSPAWTTPFTSLEVAIPENQAFAIKIPDQYGPLKQPAASYYRFRDPSKVNDGSVSKAFSFNGWFMNEDHLPQFSGLTSGTGVMLCNSYPANISAERISDQGTFQVFDYSKKSWINPVDMGGVIKSQQGFYFCPGTGVTSLNVPADAFTDESTKYKSAISGTPKLILQLDNSNAEGGSYAIVKYDELKTDEFNSTLDADALFNDMPEYIDAPIVYVLRYSKKLSTVVVPSIAESIPLGVRVQQDMTVKFSRYSSENFEKAVLLDNETGKTYNLLAGEVCEVSLKKGVYEGRFFLNLSIEDEDLPTDVDDPVGEGGSSISIFTQEDGAVVISSSSNENLVSAEITNMGGNTQKVTLSNPHYNRIVLDGTQGAYLVKAIGETQSKVAKVIVK